MKALKSQLELLDFVILNSEYKFIPVQNFDNLVSIVDSYDIDIDFAKVDDPNEVVRMFMKIEVNREDPIKDGISIVVEGMAIFRVKNATEEIKDILISRSGVSIIMNSLRGYISNMTAYAPFGRYILPSIDVVDLLNKRFPIQEADKKS